MRKIIERLLIFSIGVPLVVGLVLFLPYFNGLVLNILVTFFSGIGAVEFSLMLEKKQIRISTRTSKIESFFLGALSPAVVTLNVSFGFPEWVIFAAIITCVGWALMSRIFSRSETMGNIINQIVSGFSLIIYPGFFMVWLIKMNIWGNPGTILFFLLVTFASDSVAWLFGTLFGKNNRGLIAVSPNKSIVGFIGGAIGSIIVACCAVYIFPGIFFITDPSLYASVVILGLCTGIAAMLGDLAESAIKRSCDVKDSGKIMLGRGGILDSLDSIAVAAPVFYFLFDTFFK